MESWKEYELRARIEQLGELLTIAKKNKTVKDATEDYYLTPEGAAVKAETEAKMEQTEALFQETKEHVISTINAELNKCIGAGCSTETDVMYQNHHRVSLRHKTR